MNKSRLKVFLVSVWIAISLLLTEAVPQMLQAQAVNLAEGISSYNQGYLPKAIDLLRIVARDTEALTSERCKAYAYWGAAEFTLGDVDVAREVFSQLKQLKPNYSLDSNLFDQNIVSFFNTIPSPQPPPSLELGISLYNDDNFTQAIGVLRIVTEYMIESKSKLDTAYEYWGVCAFRKNARDEAENIFKKLLVLNKEYSIDPNFPEGARLLFDKVWDELYKPELGCIWQITANDNLLDLQVFVNDSIISGVFNDGTVLAGNIKRDRVSFSRLRDNVKQQEYSGKVSSDGKEIKGTFRVLNEEGSSTYSWHALLSVGMEDETPDVSGRWVIMDGHSGRRINEGTITKEKDFLLTGSFGERSSLTGNIIGNSVHLYHLKDGVMKQFGGTVDRQGNTILGTYDKDNVWVIIINR